MHQNPLTRALRWGWVRYRLLTRSDSFLRSSGFLRSHQLLAPVDAQDQPIPWLNYNLIHFLDQRLQPHLRLFEYGAGYSTHWFAQRVKEVVALEYDRRWERQVRHLLQDQPNVKLRFEEVGPAYIESAARDEEGYDLILVDGRERVACVEKALEALRPGGVILLDDTEREAYQAAFGIAEKAGYRALTLTGLKPFSFGREQSTLFYREGNCLGL